MKRELTTTRIGCLQLAERILWAFYGFYGWVLWGGSMGHPWGGSMGGSMGVLWHGGSMGVLWGHPHKFDIRFGFGRFMGIEVSFLLGLRC